MNFPGEFYHNTNRPTPPRYNNLPGYTYVEGMGFAPPPPVISEKRLIQAYANGIGFSVVGFLVLWMILPAFLFHTLALFLPILDALETMPQMAAVSEIIFSICNILVYLCPFAIYLAVNKIPLRAAFPFRKISPSYTLPPVMVGLGVAVMGVFTSAFISGICLVLFGVQPIGGEIEIPSTPSGIVFLFIRIALIAPIMEELVFRGAIMQSLRRFGDAFALLCSSILFSIAHQNLVQAPNAFMMGLVMGYFVIRTSSIWCGILIHIVNNALSLVMSLVLPMFTGSMQQIVIFSWYGIYLCLGILGLLLLVRRHKEMFSIRRCTTISGENAKYRAFFSAPGMIICLVGIAILFAQAFV